MTVESGLLSWNNNGASFADIDVDGSMSSSDEDSDCQSSDDDSHYDGSAIDDDEFSEDEFDDETSKDCISPNFDQLEQKRKISRLQLKICRLKKANEKLKIKMKESQEKTREKIYGLTTKDLEEMKLIKEGSKEGNIWCSFMNDQVNAFFELRMIPSSYVSAFFTNFRSKITEGKVRGTGGHRQS